MWREIRKTFLTGLLVMIPLIVTIYTILWVLNRVDSVFRTPIEEIVGFRIYGLGIIITAGIILLSGMIVTNYAGRKLFGATEYLFKKIPLVRSIYFPIKQLTETIYGSANTAFRRVVLVQYPSSGIYTIGFVTSESIKQVEDKVNKSVVCVFIPTTPNPTSGMFVMFPNEDVTTLDIGVEDAIKLVVSGGIAKPTYKEIK